MATLPTESRRSLSDAVEVSRVEIEDLRSAFREHRAALNPEARKEIWQILEGLAEMVEDLACLVEDDDSYADPESKS